MNVAQAVNPHLPGPPANFIPTLQLGQAWAISIFKSETCEINEGSVYHRSMLPSDCEPLGPYPFDKHPSMWANSFFWLDSSNKFKLCIYKTLGCNSWHVVDQYVGSSGGCQLLGRIYDLVGAHERASWQVMPIEQRCDKLSVKELEELRRIRAANKEAGGLTTAEIRRLNDPEFEED